MTNVEPLAGAGERYVLVSGGVMSGIGKGVTASSIGMLLTRAGLAVTSIKIDPYLNVDAGTMSPFEHGEVFVLADGGEVDLDLGNYERFLGVELGRDNNITTGKVYRRVIEAERLGRYLGKTVQVVPHVCNAIQRWIERVARRPDAAGRRPDVCIIELGGTVGDIEGMPFVEALRQLAWRVGRDRFVDVHVSLVPIAVDEQKTKPTQTTVARLRQLGLQPDFIMCRSAQPLTDATKAKIAMFCQLEPNRVIGVHDVSNLYGVPLLLEQQGLCALLSKRLALGIGEPELDEWRALSATADRLAALPDAEAVRIAFVGKYVELRDAYKSLIKALNHAALHIGVRHELVMIDAELLGDAENKRPEAADAWRRVRSAHAVLVPGGFGERGVGGKIAAIKYARELKVPYFGICLGLQLAVIEACRSQLNWHDAGSEEFDTQSKAYDDNELRLSRDFADNDVGLAPLAAAAAPPAKSSPTTPSASPDKKPAAADGVGVARPESGGSESGSRQRNVVVFMPEVSRTHMGGTMRLGERRTVINDATCRAAELYGATEVFERHRHRYEVNPAMVADIEAGTDLRFVGRDDTGQRMEIVEIDRANHPFFMAVQFHPEYVSRPMRPQKLIVGFMQAATARKTAN